MNQFKLCADAIVAFNIVINTFFRTRHSSSNMNFGTCRFKIEVHIFWMYLGDYTMVQEVGENGNSSSCKDKTYVKWLGLLLWGLGA
jgi:hypothetical protein